MIAALLKESALGIGRDSQGSSRFYYIAEITQSSPVGYVLFGLSRGYSQKIRAGRQKRGHPS